MIVSVHQPQYLPWLGYFDKIARSDAFVYLDTVQYKAREWQNRNKIRTKDGTMWMTVPVMTKGLGWQNICDVRVDASTDWQKDHWHSLQCWYGKAPHFERYKAFFEDVYAQAWERLMDLNIHVTEFLLKEFGITTPIYMESELGTTDRSTERIIELCQKLKADTYFTGIGGQNYLDEERFKETGIGLIYQDFQPPAYRQQYSSTEEEFLPCLSAIDLLFNEGENSRQILKIGQVP